MESKVSVNADGGAAKYQIREIGNSHCFSDVALLAEYIADELVDVVDHDTLCAGVATALTKAGPFPEDYPEDRDFKADRAKVLAWLETLEVNEIPEFAKIDLLSDYSNDFDISKTLVLSIDHIIGKVAVIYLLEDCDTMAELNG